MVSSNKRYHHHHHPWWQGIVNVILMVSVLTMKTADASASKHQYIITIDAGSSGSRVHVHKVSSPTVDQPIPQLLEATNEKIKPGLSSFADKVDKVDDEHISGLIKFAYDNVPAEEWKKTPIYLKATAGMRKIPKSAQDQIMSVVRASFSGTPFIFEDHWASVISGIDEAKYGWITVNYLNGRFGDGGKSKLLGVMEMGGASMQISYPVPKSVPADGSKVLEIELGAETYHLYAHSFLGYGLDSAQELLVEQSTPEKVALCYPPGKTFTSANIEGAGDFDMCYRELSTFVKPTNCPGISGSSRCSIGGNMLPYWDENNLQFVAIENFYYTTDFMTQGNNKLRDLASRGRDYCKGEWNDLVSKYETPKEDKFALGRYCFSTAFIIAVLEQGLGIPMLDHTEVARTAGDTDIDWPVGSVIHDVLSLHHSHKGGGVFGGRKSSSGGSGGGGFSSPIGFNSIAMIGLFFLVLTAVARRRQKKMRRNSN